MALKFGFYAPSLSFHQIPFFEELKKIWPGECTYYYQDEKHGAEKTKCGWDAAKTEGSVFVGDGDGTEVETVDVLMLSIRNLGLIERRAAKGLTTYYSSERWFKPIHGLPGWLRLLSPSYFKMARRFVKWMRADSKARFFAIGPWAEKDARLMGIPAEKIVPWGYFVSPSTRSMQSNSRTIGQANTLKILWMGRMLKWKRVDTLIKAARSLPQMSFTIVGEGPSDAVLRKLASGLKNVTFLPFQQCDKARELMREFDVLVLTSNEEEGWGAVLNEALEEGLRVIGTYEAGSSATILPESNLFHAGDYKTLTKMLKAGVPEVDFSSWTARGAAERFMRYVG